MSDNKYTMGKIEMPNPDNPGEFIEIQTYKEYLQKPLNDAEATIVYLTRLKDEGFSENTVLELTKAWLRSGEK